MSLTTDPHMLIDSRPLSTKSSPRTGPEVPSMQIVRSYVPKYLPDNFDVILRAITTYFLGKVHTGFQLLKDLAASTSENTYQTVEMYPRMPWHDVHGCVTGAAAEDLAAHFVQVLLGGIRIIALLYCLV